MISGWKGIKWTISWQQTRKPGGNGQIPKPQWATLTQEEIENLNRSIRIRIWLISHQFSSKEYLGLREFTDNSMKQFVVN